VSFVDGRISTNAGVETLAFVSATAGEAATMLSIMTVANNNATVEGRICDINQSDYSD
jgi:hypothetical protein